MTSLTIRYISVPRVPASALSFEATIDVVEMLGKEKILYARLENDKELIISTPGHFEYVGGEKHKFGFDIGAIHFFDTETENRIN